VTSLLLTLQWGGNEKPWNSADVIATLVLAFVLLAMFIGWEWYLGDKAMVPLQLLRRRTQLGCCAEAVRRLIQTMSCFSHFKLPTQFFVFLMLQVGVYYGK